MQTRRTLMRSLMEFAQQPKLSPRARMSVRLIEISSLDLRPGSPNSDALTRLINEHSITIEQEYSCGLEDSTHQRVVEPAASTHIPRRMEPMKTEVHRTSRPGVRRHLDFDTFPAGVHTLRRVLFVLVANHAAHNVVVAGKRPDAAR